ncbi:hypothetical protein [Methanobrevibacter sp.]|uniref:hypothetical protein n=1 Tax=Methanobrevibacter sp. TaxID=66852 RepID=UPI003D7D6193
MEFITGNIYFQGVTIKFREPGSSIRILNIDKFAVKLAKYLSNLLSTNNDRNSTYCNF